VAASLRRASLLALLLLLVSGCRTGVDAARNERAARLAPRLGELLLVGFHGTALPLDLVPARSAALTDLAVVAGFAVVMLAAAVALCRRRA